MKDFSHFIKVKIKVVVPLFTIFYVKYIWTTNKIRTKFSKFEQNSILNIPSKRKKPQIATYFHNES